VPDLVFRWAWLVLDELADRHDHARRAVAALEGVLILERLLHRVEGAVRVAEALDRGDLAAVGLGGEDGARLHRDAVQCHRAGAALGGVTADVGAGEPEAVAQEVDEEGAGGDRDDTRGAVDRQADGDLTHGGHRRPPSCWLHLCIPARGGLGCERLQCGPMSLFRSGSSIMAIMRLSARADYALRAAIELAAAHDGHVTAEQLAQAQNIPGKFLETILTHLRRSNIVRSQRGPDGGFWLARPASEISLADIIRAIDGQLLGVRGERPENVTYPGAAAPLQRVWIALRANERAVLETVTLADIVSGELPAAVAVLTDSPQAWV
jgi:Rrf2 family protein